MKFSANKMVVNIESQKKIDAVRQYYRDMMLGRLPVVGASFVGNEPRQSHPIGITPGSTFIPHEEVDTRWYRVDNSRRKSKWTCLGHDDELDEETYRRQYNPSQDRRNRKERKAYRAAKVKQENAAMSAASLTKKMYAPDVVWADAE
jgi:hypothetical protein